MPWLMLTDGNTDVDEDGYSNSAYALSRVLSDIGDFDTGLKSSFEAGSQSGKLYQRCLLDLRRSKSYDIECPEGYGRVCWGSAHGWIVTAGGDGRMFMFNPLTKSRVGLPSFSTFRYQWDSEDLIRRNFFVARAVVLRVGDDYGDAQTCGDGVEDLRVVAFYGDDHVAIAKPGNKRWVEINGGTRSISCLMDVVYDCNMGLIFVDDCGGLLSCKLPENEEESPLLKWFPRSVHEEEVELRDQSFYVGTYILKCGADLVMVQRALDYLGDQDDDVKYIYRRAYGARSDTYGTSFFDVLKFDFSSKSWVDYDLKDLALFVGNNASMWVDSRNAGCERNCIYFTDDVRRHYHYGKDNLGGHDSGVRLLSSPRGSVPWSQPLAVPEGRNTLSPYCCPLWFRPSVCVPKNFN